MKKIFILVIIIISITVGLFLSFGTNYLTMLKAYKSLEKNMITNGYVLALEIDNEFLVMDYNSASDYTITADSEGMNFNLTCSDNSSFEYSDDFNLNEAAETWNYHYSHLDNIFVDFNRSANDLCQQFHSIISYEYNLATSLLQDYNPILITPIYYEGYFLSSEGTLGEVRINHSSTTFEIWNDISSLIEIEVIVKP